MGKKETENVRFGELRNGVLVVRRSSCVVNRSIARHQEVKLCMGNMSVERLGTWRVYCSHTREWDQIHSQLAKVAIELARESQAGANSTHHFRNYLEITHQKYQPTGRVWLSDRMYSVEMLKLRVGNLH